MALIDFGIGETNAATINTLGNWFIGNAQSKKQYHYQSDLMYKQQNWLEKMSNTAHQREVEDLRKAGLNPILSATGGSGASTPQSGMGQVNMPDYGSATEAITTAMQIKRQSAETKLIDEQAKTEEQKRENFEADSGLKRALKFIQEVKGRYAEGKEQKELENLEKDLVLKTVQASATHANAITNRMNAESNAMNAQTNRMVGKEQAKYTKERNRGGGLLETIGEGTQNWLDNLGIKRYADNPFRRKN